MKKYLIDASIIGGSLYNFRKRYCVSDCILIMSDKTLIELENQKKKDFSECDKASVAFVRFLIDYFVRNVNLTEVFTLETNSSHIDKDLVNIAQKNNWGIITADKGMALYARIKEVEYVLIESRNSRKFSNYVCLDNKVLINIYDLPAGEAIFVKSYPYKIPDEDGNIEIDEGDTIWHMHSSNSSVLCCVDIYVFTHNNFEYSGTSSFETEFEVMNSDYQKLYFKWLKNKNFNF